jgi:tRNA A-37 threonylcarbamoyl transferase component Bud32/tetratricopeptide (TPR) repeat protein
MDVLDDLHAALEGRYEIERELGRGGMAVVYLARDTKHDRHVAIKVLPPEMVTSVGAERFLREIRTAAQLSHPNILPLHDSIAVDRVRCYVMPYVQGESLRQRIDHERQLGIEQAVDLTRQIAAGLDYAHAHGIVHRDIKPENILLVGDQAMIADFGLALAVYSASSRPFTATGMAVGTPVYMSPEQAAADHAIDARTDIYSLGCVFFEMVAGMPPFRGATAGALLAAHATRTPPSLCGERATCPPGMDAAVQRALAKVPADRFRTAGEFAHALDASRAGTPLSAPVIAPRRAWVPLAAVATAVAALLVAAPRIAERVQLSRVPLDSSRVVVLPAEGSGGQRITAAVARQRVMSALMEWRDLRVVEPPVGTTGGVDAAEARRIARRGGAARLLSMSVAPMGDSVEIRATLTDASGEPVRQQAIRVADEPRSGAGPYRQLAAALLRTSDGEDESDDVRPGTTRMAAWRAFTRGDSLRRAWALDGAEREFRHAVALDPAFARAHLWLAQVALWQRPTATREWGEEGGRALSLAGGLTRHDSLLAEGLAALGSRRFPEACAAFHALHAASPKEDLSWYGLGACQAFDDAVLTSTASPSGWAFRSSWASATAAFDSALAHTTSAPAFAYRMLGGMLYTEPAVKRQGRGLASRSGVFYSSPQLIGDTVAFIPYLASDVLQGFGSDPTRLSQALQRNSQRLLSSYEEWIRRAPRNPEALAALARVKESRGDVSALTLIRRARSLSDTSQLGVALAVSEVRLLVKSGQFDAARGAADSLLRANPDPTPDRAELLAGVAALVGNIERSGELLAVSARADPQAAFGSRYPAPAALIGVAGTFLATAAAGACTDSLGAYVGEIDRMITQYAPGDQRAELRRALLSRPVSLAVPCLGARATLAYPGDNSLLRMQQQFAAGDTRGLRSTFALRRAARAGLRPGDVTFDFTFQEATLLLMLGDTAAASQYLDLPLTALPTLNTHLLDNVPGAFALGRAMALRAELAAAAGDSTTARRYARNLMALWRGASASLQPVLRRMAALSS